MAAGGDQGGRVRHGSAGRDAGAGVDPGHPWDAPAGGRSGSHLGGGRPGAQIAVQGQQQGYRVLLGRLRPLGQAGLPAGVADDVEHGIGEP